MINQVIGTTNPDKQHKLTRDFFNLSGSDLISMEIFLDTLVKRLAQEISLDEIKEIISEVCDVPRWGI